MSTITSTEILWVVLDAEDRIVIICGGADAPSAAAEWRDRGYRTQPLDRPELRPA